MSGRLRAIASLVILGILLWGGWFGWESWRLNKVRAALTEVVQSTDLDALLRGEEPAPSMTANSSASSAPKPEEIVDPSGIGDNSAPVSASAPAGTAVSQNTLVSGADVSDVNPVDLALRNILLSQGEQGLELWRLQANWATLRQESGLVEVREPHVRYALGDPQGERDGKPYFADEQFVNVTSRTGRVTDNNSRITLEGHVRSEYQGDVLTGPVAEFNNADRVLLYPQGATLEGATLNGFAHVLRWNMATNTLEGEQGVTLIWIPEPDPAAPTQNQAIVSDAPVMP